MYCISETSTTDRRLQSQLAAEHAHVYRQTALLLCSICFHLFTSVVAWYHILFRLSDKMFCPSLLLSFFFLYSSLCLPFFFVVSVKFLVCPIMSDSFMLKNNLSISVFWAQTVDHALIYFSSLLFLSLSPASHRPFYFGMPP